MLNYIYILKVLLCSLIITGYYYVVLRNKAYHQYNRFYLLFIIIASWLIPLLPFNIFIEQQSVSAPLYKVVEYVSTEKSIIYTNASMPLADIKQHNKLLTAKNMSMAILVIPTLYFLVILIISLFNMHRLMKKYKAQKLSNYTIYITNEKYTPYSFFNCIFWNKKIDLNSQLGQQILQHELVHINEKHSIDKLFMQINLIIGWFNPFFWIIKNELEMIHEFIADKKSIPNGNTSQFAEMILSIAQVNKSIPLTNAFFFSPIKRRLNMLTTNHALKFSYIQKIVALPVVAFLVLMVSLKTKQALASSSNFISVNNNNKQGFSEIIRVLKNKNVKQQSIAKSKAVYSNKNYHKISSPNDSTIATISQLQQYYLDLEQTYKKETAIAIERKKLMELLEKQSLEENTMITIFNSIIKTPFHDKTLQNQLKQEVEQKIGKENMKLFWNEKNRIQQETENYLRS